MARSVFASLEYRLAAVVSTGLLLFTLLVGGVSFFIGYQNEINIAGHVQKQLVETVRSQAAIAAYTGNAEVAKDVLDSLIQHDSISAIELTSSQGTEYKREDKNRENIGEHTHYTLLSPIDQQTTIGTLRVSANKTVIRTQAIKSAMSNAVFLVLQVFLTTVLLAVAFRRVVSKPISKLAYLLSSIRPGSEERLQIDDRHVRDEIGLLSSSANLLLDSTQHALSVERKLRRKVEEMEQHYRRIFETTHVGIFVMEASGRLINSNPILQEKIIGVSLDKQNMPLDFLAAIFLQSDMAWSMVREALSRENAVSADLQLRTLDGSPRWAHCIVSVSKDSQGKLEMIEGVLYDVTSRREQEEDARERAEKDALTQLYNRHGCEIFIDRSLRNAANDSLVVGVMLIDLDGFKAVNDTQGHAAGDIVLTAVATRLREVIRRSSDLVGRLGGDEFIVITYNCGEGEQLLSQIAKDIIASISRPVPLPTGDTAHVSASIGISRFPRDGLTRDMLFERADAAMYEVKRHGKNGYAFTSGAPVEVATASAAAVQRR